MTAILPVRKPRVALHRAHRFRLPALPLLLAALGAGALAWLAADPRSSAPPVRASEPALRHAPPVSVRFAACGILIADNCVIDGDTFTLNGTRIRIADIDAPETRNAQCAAEARLGLRATERLRTLLNEGPFELGGYARETDRYGRKLRIVRRNGQSIGAILVREGLARRWSGTRRGWCA
jgi:endonuclease YncB( thermonuclease family)